MDLYLTEPVGPFHIAAGAQFDTFTAKKSVDPLPFPVIPGGKLRRGTKLYMKAWGHYSALTTSALTLGFWFGTRAVPPVITGDIALGGVFTTAVPVAWPWWQEWEGTCTLDGPAGTLVGQGQQQFGSALTTFNAEVPIPVTAALRTVTIDTTIERAIGVSATWGVSSASNLIVVNGLRAVIWN